MKKIITLALALAFVTPVQAQASCGEGQSSGVDYNVTTKQTTTFCYTPEPRKTPTQQEIEIKIQESVSKTITEQKNADAPTVTTMQTFPVAEENITQPANIMEVNATTGVVTIRPMTESETKDLVKSRIANKTREAAQSEAERLSKENQGIRQCVNWSAEGQSGTECNLEPIPATEEEITEGFDWLKNLNAFDWFGFLAFWSWNWLW